MTEILHPEPKNIYPTPDKLLQDSESLVSQEGIAEWEEAQATGSQVIAHACSDARVSVRHSLESDNSIVSVTSIAAAQPLLQFRFALTHPGVSQQLMVGHMTCGGLGAYAHLENGHEVPNDDVYEYVNDNIESSDVVIQTTARARGMANISNRPTLSLVMNHETEELYPVAYFTHRGRKYYAPFSMEDIYAKDKDRIYQGNFMPPFNEELLPDEMRFLLEKNRQQVAKNKNNPQFLEAQKIQNPNSILVSTSTIPASIRYPSTFGEPNTCFTIRLPLIKNSSEGFDFTINPNEAIQQADYPIAHSMNGHESFSKTKRLIIETPNLHYSKMIADRFMQRPKVRDWIDSHNASIIVTELQSAKEATKTGLGKTIAAEDYLNGS